MSLCALYDIVQMRGLCDGLVLYEILKWVFVWVWRLFVWYYLNDGLYVSECALYDIIEMRDLCVWIGFKWSIKMSVCMCLKALCMILFKWYSVCVSKRFIWYYWNERFMCQFDFIWNIKMSVCKRLNSLWMILIKWWPACVWMRFIWYYLNERFMCLDWFNMKY